MTRRQTAMLLAPHCNGHWANTERRRATWRKWSVLLDQEEGGKRPLEEVTNDLNLDWHEELIMNSSFVSSPPPLDYECLSGTVCCLCSSPSFRAWCWVHSRCSVNVWWINEQAKKRTARVRIQTPVSLQRAEEGQIDMGWKGAAGRLVSSILLPAQNRWISSHCALRYGVLEASGQSLQDLCSFLKLKTVSR